jgi:hypothetical protein
MTMNIRELSETELNVVSAGHHHHHHADSNNATNNNQGGTVPVQHVTYDLLRNEKI